MEMLEFWRHLQQKLISWTVKKMEWDADELDLQEEQYLTLFQVVLVI